MAAPLENDFLPEKEWPPAVEVLNEGGRSDIVLLCEHASNHIPGEYGQLGLDASHLQRHIAWDIGAAEVTRHLSRLLDAPAFLSGYSRLLIDLNRPLGTKGSIPVLVGRHRHSRQCRARSGRAGAAGRNHVHAFP